MIKVSLSNEILKYITDIDKNRYHVHDVKIPNSVASKLRKNSKKKMRKVTKNLGIRFIKRTKRVPFVSKVGVLGE